MFKRLVIEKRNGRIAAEETLLSQHAATLGIPVVTAYEKHVARGHFKFEPTDLVAGGVSFIHHALRAFGYRLHPQMELSTYPPMLRDMMYRQILPIYDRWALRLHMASTGKPVFVKPVKTKRFTGFVCHEIHDPRFNGAGNATELHVTEVVKFVSEWRFYIAHDKIVDMQFADHGGDSTIKPDATVVEDAVNRIRDYGNQAAGYVLDFGVLDTGETALVELNDGYAIGAYGTIRAEQYWQVIAARWAEIIKKEAL